MRKTFISVIIVLSILLSPSFVFAQTNITDDNHDNDELADSVDVDDDNDGIPDRYEFATGKNARFIPGSDPGEDDDEDGIANFMDADNSTCGGLTNGVCLNYDTDGDGVPNHFDLDSDNDGIPDVMEAGGHDNDGDGRLDCLGSCDSDGDGLLTPVDISDERSTYAAIDISKEAVTPNTYIYGGSFYFGVLDSDGDIVPDFLDIDSDNDGIYDIIEAGGAEAVGNGRVNFTGTFAANDTDNDGLINIYDADSNNDFDIIDVGEGVQKALIISMNATADGIADNWSDGLPVDIFKVNLDSDLLPNYRDLESDNDGINDVLEAGASIGDNDGIVGTGSYNIGNFNSQGYRTSLTIPLIVTDPDTTGDGRADDNDDIGQSPYRNGGGSTFFNPDPDGDSRPNFIDLDSDNDGFNDINEHIGTFSTNDIDSNGMFDIIAEMDFDGIAPAADGDSTRYGDNGNVDPLNSDGPDPTISTADSDTKPDYLDLDTDNDGSYDTEENGNAEFDANVDGIIDCAGNVYVDCDTDIDGILAFVDNAEGVVGDSAGNPLPNSDARSFQTPDYRDLDSDNNGVNDVVQKAPPVLLDADNDGRADGTDTDGDGIINVPLLDSNNVFGGTAGQNNVLPVSLLDFKAQTVNKAIVLNWKTSTEINSSHFDVLRSTDGIKFETIGTVTAHGNSSVINNYELIDQSPFQGLNFYRLKMADIDGKTDYSKIINIRFIENSKGLVTVSPNPIHREIKLNFNGLDNGFYKVVVSNSFGQVHLSDIIKIDQYDQKLTLKPKGVLSKGVYILNIYTVSRKIVFSGKIIVQ